MNKFIAMIILKPDIKNKRIDNVQNSILNMFEQNTKVHKIWYLGKKQLDFKNKKYTEGIYLKLDVSAKYKKVEKIRQELRKNQYILSSIIMINDNGRSYLPKFKVQRLPFYKSSLINTEQLNELNKKIYVLISKNIKLPFAESDIIAISEDENKILQYANKKIQEFIYMKGYRTLKNFRIITDVQKDLKKYRKVQFTLDNNFNVGQELLIQERNLI